MAHAERVFDAPQEPQVHQTEFLNQCMERIALQSEKRDPVKAADARAQ